MKDQLKKTFSDTPRHIPTKHEEVIKAEDTFLTEDFSQMTFEDGYRKEYNPFRSTNRQQTYDQELDTYNNKVVTATIVEEIISVDTTNNNLN